MTRNQRAVGLLERGANHQCISVSWQSSVGRVFRDFRSRLIVSDGCRTSFYSRSVTSRRISITFGYLNQLKGSFDEQNDWRLGPGGGGWFYASVVSAARGITVLRALALAPGISRAAAVPRGR
jgi:hypothetical protein